MEKRDNSGVLFANNRKEKDTHPDWTGKITIDGVERYLSAWTKQGRMGDFFSLSIGKPVDEPARAQAPQRNAPPPRRPPTPAPGYDDFDGHFDDRGRPF